ncbi:hypothetical protein Hanom_Chr10g00923561 [Helianthus anomalus]
MATLVSDVIICMRRFSKQEAACLEDKAQGSINRTLDIICMGAFGSHHPGGAHPGWIIIFVSLLSHSMKLSMFKSLKLSSFLFIFACSWLESPFSLFFTEPILKLDRYETIIWYQSSRLHRQPL